MLCVRQNRCIPRNIRFDRTQIRSLSRVSHHRWSTQPPDDLKIDRVPQGSTRRSVLFTKKYQPPPDDTTVSIPSMTKVVIVALISGVLLVTISKGFLSLTDYFIEKYRQN